MKHSSLRKNAGIAAAVLALSVSLAACGSDDDDKDSSGGSGDESTSAGDQTFGEGCASIPTDGAGSFDGMVQDPVATAASNNPLLSTLVTAVGAVDGLAGTLNDAESLTVFAPYNDAFAAIPEADLNALLEGAATDGQDSTLSKILAHHVVAMSADTEAVVGDHETLAGDTLTIEGDEDGMTVSDGTVTAKVLCGNIPTANATVYVIDTVLTGVK